MPFVPPRHQELAVLVELGDARILQTVGDEQAAVRQPRDVLRPAEVRGVLAGDIGDTKRQHELLAVVGELVDLMTGVVDHPDVFFRVVRIDPDLVRTAAAFEQLVPLRPRLHQLAVAVHDEDAVAHFGFGLGRALIE